MDNKVLEKVTQGVIIALVISNIFCIAKINSLGNKPQAKAKAKAVPTFGRQEAEVLVESSARILRDEFTTLEQRIVMNEHSVYELRSEVERVSRELIDRR